MYSSWSACPSTVQFCTALAFTILPIFSPTFPISWSIQLKRTLPAETRSCGKPAISLLSHHVSLVQWTTCLLPTTRDPGSNPRRVLMWNRDSPVSIVSLHWWPRHDWSSLPRLRRDSSQTVTRPSCRHCYNPTWSHTAFLSWFHTRCRFPFRLHNRRSRLLGGGGALWRACNLTFFSPCLTGPVDYLFASRHKRPRFKSQGGYLCETRILLLVLSCYSLPQGCKHPDATSSVSGYDGNSYAGCNDQLEFSTHLE